MSSTLIQAKLLLEQMMQRGDEAVGDDGALMAAFELHHPDAFASILQTILKAGFSQFARSVGRRRQKAGDGSQSQGDLFGTVSHPEMIHVPQYRDGKFVRFTKKLFKQAHIEEIDAYQNYRDRPRTRGPRRDAGMTQIADAIRPFMVHGKTTAEEGMALAAAAFAEAKKREEGP